MRTTVREQPNAAGWAQGLTAAPQEDERHEGLKRTVTCHDFDVAG